MALTSLTLLRLEVIKKIFLSFSFEGPFFVTIAGVFLVTGDEGVFAPTVGVEFAGIALTTGTEGDVVAVVEDNEDAVDGGFVGVEPEDGFLDVKPK